MTRSGTPTSGRRRWWSLALLVHAGLALLFVTADATLTGIDTWAGGAVFAGRIALGAPWWLLTAPLLLLLPVPEADRYAVLTAVPVLINVVVHALVVRFGRPAASAPEAPAVPRGAWYRSTPSTSGAFGLAVLAGMVVWATWLGWDHLPSFDVLTGTVQAPYVTVQVLGCAVSVGVVTAVMARHWSPVASAAGMSVGFWVCWTAEAAASDETGLFVIGAAMLAAGLIAGTTVAALVGRVVQHNPWQAGVNGD